MDEMSKSMLGLLAGLMLALTVMAGGFVYMQYKYDMAWVNKGYVWVPSHTHNGYWKKEK